MIFISFIIKNIVSDKLLKQAFAIAKSGLIYNDSYRSTLVIKLSSFYLFFTTVLC
ncbi:hypothetical protein DDD_3165 [Nonlabens dokdonensis DSW-6]|uniref:Uncharacterized protein n=1 Tax=Nonlabens dokdonensis (strain DSM 17205 / KCTC 12402 / DSW-6) TaxID=592029 RepID=L7WDJ2_NONDD|nr:hypothetical protein DDD_3165 [Nonlabens dokdonensis DSW-6]